MSPPKIRPALTEPEWRNGRRAGFKIPYPSLGVWVRLPPSVLISGMIIARKRAQNPGLSGVFAFLAEGVRQRDSQRTNSQPLSGLLSDSQVFGQVWAREFIRAGCLDRLTLLMRRSRCGRASREGAETRRRMESCGLGHAVGGCSEGREMFDQGVGSHGRGVPRPARD